MRVDRTRLSAVPTEESPWLVADIGGTNARFGLVRRAGGPPEAVAVLPGAEYDGLPDAVAAYLGLYGGGVRPGAACLAIAKVAYTPTAQTAAASATSLWSWLCAMQCAIAASEPISPR